jgi:hypothetical protein
MLKKPSTAKSAIEGFFGFVLKQNLLQVEKCLLAWILCN